MAKLAASVVVVKRPHFAYMQKKQAFSNTASCDRRPKPQNRIRARKKAITLVSKRIRSTNLVWNHGIYSMQLGCPAFFHSSIESMLSSRNIPPFVVMSAPTAELLEHTINKQNKSLSKSGLQSR